MSLVGALGMFRVKPAIPIGAGGKMALADHFRELRGRLLRSIAALLVLTIASFFVYDQLLDIITKPYFDAIDMLGGAEKAHSQIYISGIAGGLMLQLKLCSVAGVVASSPVWLYQLWAFIVPGLHRNERRWTRLFVVVAGPLFFAGVATGYYVLPKGLQVLISFNPSGFENLNNFNDFFSFIVRMLLVFGISFEIPFFVVLLNLAGIVSAKSLSQHRSWIIIGTFVFAAVATPSTDPWSMLLLAFPMTLLFLISEVIAHVVDRRRGRRAAAETLDDDTASAL